MTTRDPGASVVFTHGRLVSPRCTAFLASSPAPSITEGLDVLVHDVIAAMTTCPWSMFAVLPSSNVTGTGSVGHSWASAQTWVGGGTSRGTLGLIEIGSLAGNDPADASSSPPCTGSGCGSPASRHRKVCWAAASAIRSWGRFGPAIDGSTVARSSSIVWL